MLAKRALSFAVGVIPATIMMVLAILGGLLTLASTFGFPLALLGYLGLVALAIVGTLGLWRAVTGPRPISRRTLAAIIAGEIGMFGFLLFVFGLEQISKFFYDPRISLWTYGVVGPILGGIFEMWNYASERSAT